MQSNDVIDFLQTHRLRKWSRRNVLRSAAAISGLLTARRQASAAQYAVGVGRSTDAYSATNRAIDACGEWGALTFTNKVVVIKPNLVGRALPQTGITTDSQVVRAIVDRVLAAGAIFVAIIESGPHGANFAECGYSFFDTYDRQGRVRLLDLAAVPTELVALPNGWIYRSIYSKPLVLDRNHVFIDVAKLKTHAETLVTLGTKNMFGLPTIDRYISSPPGGRFAMHDRGLGQAIIDNYNLRPPDFTVIDGMVAMQGNGPWAGLPVTMNTVLAGRNTLAVDRVGLAAMGISQFAVRHLNYSAMLGLGPANLSQVSILGDTLAPRTFLLPPVLPVNCDPARVTPGAFAPGQGQSVTIDLRYAETCDREVSILRVSDLNNTATLVRTIAPLGNRAAGAEAMTWDGRTNTGALTAPGLYAVHVKALRPDGQSRATDATTWVTVQ